VTSLVLVTEPVCAQAPVPPAGVLVVRAREEDRVFAEALAERLRSGALEDGRDLIAPPGRTPTIEAGWLERSVLEAEDHFARFALEEARAVLGRAVVRLDRDGPRGVTTRGLIELFLLSARIEQALGEVGLAAHAARAALAIDPSLVVDEERHPPTVTALVEAARGTLSRCPLTLAFTPAEAEVAVDGGPPSAPPTSLPCGEHWLEVSMPGYESEGRHVILDPAEALPVLSIALRLDVAAALDGAAPEDAASAPSPLAEQAAASLGRELVVLDVARDGDQRIVALGDRRVRAALGATPDEVIALLRAAGRIEGGGVDLGLAAGIGVGAALAVATLVTVLAVALNQPPPSGFLLRGEILP
jgi:hypothetical protein